MPHQIEVMPDEPIIVITHLPPYRLEESAMITAAIVDWSHNRPPPLYVIRDATLIYLTWNVMLKLLAKHIRGDVGTLTDSRLSNIFVGIGNDLSLRAGLRELDRQTFGRVNLNIFETLDDALRYCRDELAHTKPTTRSSVSGDEHD